MPNRRVPLQEQVEKEVRQWIEVGKYDSGDQLPPAREIAELCGGIKEQTVRRALKTLMEEGLIEGAQGKGIFVTKSEAKHRRIALVLPNLEDELTIQISRGARRIFDESGLHTLILDAHRDSEKERTNIAQLEDLPVDGAVIFPLVYKDTAEWILRLKMDGFPAVLVDNYFPAITIDCVLADDYGGAYAMTSALLERGYKSIGWIGSKGFSTGHDRLEGYRWALGDHGIPISRELVRLFEMPSPTAPNHDFIAQALNALLALKKVPRAIFCEADNVALQVIELLKERNLSVPGDIAIAGFDDLQAARHCSPRLTTVRKPMEEIGAIAAARLLRRIENKHLPHERLVSPTEVVIRESA